MLFQVIALNCASESSAAFGLARVIGVVLPVVRSIAWTSPGASGVLTTATPRLPSAETDSIRPDQLPPATGATAPVATETLKTPPRARVCAPNTIDWPSADQEYCPMAPLNDAVSLRGSPPSAGTTQSLSSARSHDVSARREVGERFAFGRPLDVLLGRLIARDGRQRAG